MKLVNMRIQKKTFKLSKELQEKVDEQVKIARLKR